MTHLPSHQEIKKPLLSLVKRRKEVSLVDALAHIVEHFGLSKKAVKAMQDCGKETVLQNRLRWARWELKREGLIETTRRGYFKLV
jgi:restriction system protein